MKKNAFVIFAIILTLALSAFSFACVKDDGGGEENPPPVDYGTLSIENVTLLEGEKAEINPVFSKEAYEITYEFPGDKISIENGEITALKAGIVTVMATTPHHSVAFTVTVTALEPVDYGTLSIANLTVEVGSSVEINPVFSKDTYEITYAFDGKIVSINNGVLTGVAEGSVTITATTPHHSVTFTVTVEPKEVIDYGTLTISNVSSLTEGERTKLFVVFSKNEYKSDVVYEYDQTVISIENGYVYALKGGERVTVKATTDYHETTFTVVTLINYGELVVADTTAWVGYPAVDVYPQFTKPEYAEEVTYSCSQSGISIEGNKISVTKAGTYSVRATTSKINTLFTVTAKEVDTTHTWYQTNERFDYKADTRLKKWQSEGIDGSTTIYIGDSFFDYSECWPDFETTHYLGKDAMCIGISGSKTYHWETWGKGWLSETNPKNVVMHIGTNNVSAGDSDEGTFDSLKRMFTIMHDELPDTHFYWFSITHHAASSDAVIAKNKIRDSVNLKMKQWCEERDYITYVHTVDSISGDMLHDGVHPIVKYYKIFVDAVAEAGIEINDLPESRKGIEVINQGYDHIYYDATTKTVTGGVEYVAPYRAAGIVRKDGVFYEGNYSVSGKVTIIPSQKEHLLNSNYWVGLFVAGTYHDVWYSTSRALPAGVMAFKGGVTQFRGYYADVNTNAGNYGKITNNTFTYKIIAYNGTIIVGVNGIYKKITDEKEFTNTYFGINGENCKFTLTMDFVTDEEKVRKDCEETGAIAQKISSTDEIEDVSFDKTETIGGTGKTFPTYKKKQLTDNYVVSGKIDVYDSDKSKSNGQGPHLHIGFGTSTTDRILLFDRSLSGKYELGLPYEYPTDGSDTFVKPTNGTLTIEWKVVKVNGNAFFYLDGELRAVYTGMSKVNGLLIGSEWNTCKFYDMQAVTKEFDGDKYTQEIAKYESLINQYSAYTANQKIRV